MLEFIRAFQEVRKQTDVSEIAGLRHKKSRISNVPV
jgi:hypothetical protein